MGARKRKRLTGSKYGVGDVLIGNQAEGERLSLPVDNVVASAPLTAVAAATN